MCKTGQSTFENILAQEFDICWSLQEWHNIFTNLQTGFLLTHSTMWPVWTDVEN